MDTLDSIVERGLSESYAQDYMARRGSAAEMYKFAKMYRDGDSIVVRSYSDFDYWLRESAKCGDPDAMCDLGLIYLNGVGKFEKNLVKAKRLFARAAEKKHAAALYHLGEFYRWNEPAPEKARECLQIAAEKKYVPALHSLGIMICSAAKTDKEYKDGIVYLREAERLGCREATLNIVAFESMRRF